MADLADPAEPGGPPVLPEASTSPQRPYAADPGTLTEWYTTTTAELDRDGILATLTAMNTKYANISTLGHTVEHVTSLLKELGEDVLASEALASFLTVSTPAETGKAMVIAVSRLSRFRSGIGQTSRFDGNVYGFLGEVEDNQLPTLVKLPDNMSLRQALAPRELTAPSGEEFLAWYGEGPTNPRVPIQGDGLMTEEGGAVGQEERVKVPYLQYLPAAWAPYFLAPQSPEQAMRTWSALERTNVTRQHGLATTGVTKWLAAACVRNGSVGANRSRSKLHMAWVPCLGIFDRELTRWAVRRLSPFLTVAPPVIPPMLVGAPVHGTGDAGQPAAGVMPYGMPPVVGAATMMPYEARETKVYSPLEHERIRMACGLDPANYEAGRPPIYAIILAEGRSMVKVEAVLQKFMAPAADDWDPIRVYVSQELVRDIKDLKFGWGNENTYDTCHRGISPFAVLQVSMEQQTKRRKTQERAERATFLSTDDVKSLEAEPGCCPPTYYGMLNLLKRYIRLLNVLFGTRCAHLL